MQIKQLFYVEVTSNNYNPDRDTTITITATAKDFNDNPIPNKSLTIKKNGTVLYTGTTNSNGQISTTTTCGTGGVYNFSVKSWNCIVTVNPYPIGSIISYEISSSNYNPTIDSSVTITVKAVSTDGGPVPNCPFVLNANGTDVSLTAGTNGIATYTYTCSSWGLHTFSVSDNSIQINVKGWKKYRNDNNYKVYYNDEYVWFRFDISGANATTTWTELGANVFPDDFIRPSTNVFFFIGMTGYIGNVRPESPKFRYRTQTGSGTNLTFTGEVMWRRK